MTKLLTLAVVLAAGIGLGVRMSEATGAPAAEPQIGHIVFFQLKDGADAKVKELVAACDKYLNDHPGTVYYSAGSFAKEFDRDVNDKDWHVALHLVFKTKADYKKYADAPRHMTFIEENKANWKKVRVFDSHIAAK